MTQSDLLQPGWRESTKRINGLDLHLVEAGEPGQPLLILLHGFPEFWWAWRHQITPLAEAGYHVVVPDQRGYNRSDAPRGIDAYVLDTLAADVVALADSFGAARFDLVGHDWGAIVAWWVGATHGQRLDHLVVMDGPHPETFARQARKHPTQAARSAYVAFFQLPVVPEATLSAGNFKALRTMLDASAHRGAFEPGALDRYVEAWAQPGRLTGMLNYYRALTRHKSRSEPIRITPPTLILWGENDSFLEHHVAEASLATCEQGRLVVVAGATHWLHLEQPARINREILRFLAPPIAP